MLGVMLGVRFRFRGMNPEVGRGWGGVERGPFRELLLPHDLADAEDSLR